MLEIALAASSLFGVLALWGIVRLRAVERAGRRFEVWCRSICRCCCASIASWSGSTITALVDRSRWDKEIGYFFAKIVFQALARPTIGATSRSGWTSSSARLEAMVEAGRQMLGAEARFERVRNGAEFELFCAEELKRGGWRVALTGPSRDQGADLVAERGQERLIVQCKLLGRPVGNYAVQEVVAARSHHQGNRALVVVQPALHASCVELAASNGVELCHWSELARL